MKKRKDPVSDSGFPSTGSNSIIKAYKKSPFLERFSIVDDGENDGHDDDDAKKLTSQGISQRLRGRDKGMQKPHLDLTHSPRPSTPIPPPPPHTLYWDHYLKSACHSDRVLVNDKEFPVPVVFVVAASFCASSF